ncbi:hypothetical protein ACOMHN_049011 [Nucella lapillus]
MAGDLDAAYVAHCFEVNAARTEAPIFSSPVITTTDQGKPYLLFGSHDTCLHCISHTGQQVWKHQLTSTVYASPFVFSLRQAQENRPDNNFSITHHMDEPEEQNEKSDPSSRHLGESLKEDIGVNGSETVSVRGCEAKFDLQPRADTCTAHLQSSKSLLSELDTERPVCPNRLKNGTTEVWCGPTRKKCEVCRNREEEEKKDDLSSSAGADISPTECPLEGDHSSPGRLVACASTDGLVRILNVATGELIGQKHLPGEVFSSPVVVDDCLIVGCRDDRVYCYRLVHDSQSNGH